MFERLRRFEVQAVWSVVSSLVSVAPMVVASWLAWRNFDVQMGRIVYGSKGYFLMGFAVCVLASMAPGALGFVLGWSSAGQRRNERSVQSWLGFFLGGLVLTADFVLLAALYMLRLEQPM